MTRSALLSTVALARLQKSLYGNRFNGSLGSSGKTRETVQTVQRRFGNSDHRAKATVLMRARCATSSTFGTPRQFGCGFAALCFLGDLSVSAVNSLAASSPQRPRGRRDCAERKQTYHYLRTHSLWFLSNGLVRLYLIQAVLFCGCTFDRLG
jgi:hypothetical protein